MHLPVGLLMRDLHETQDQHAEVRQIFLQHSYIEAAYEDIQSSADEAMSAILGFIGVELTNLSAPTKKILPIDPSSFISNIIEIREALRGSKFEGMI
jgi:hypothetical protein